MPITIKDNEQVPDSASRKKSETLIKKFCSTIGINNINVESNLIYDNSLYEVTGGKKTINYYHLNLEGEFPLLMNQYNALMAFCAIHKSYIIE